MTRTIVRMFWLFAAAIGLATDANAERPNVLVIMVDDLGFSDLGCYGGEIDTPTLDALAANGLQFSQFYNTAKCHSSRVSLLTGQYCIAAGDVRLTHAVTTAEVLRDAGYFTAMVGKWHLAGQPTDFGFERYFGHLSGACNYFYGDSTFRLNGQPWKVPKDGFYTTVANVDYGLEFLKEAGDSAKPWFLYVAFNAPHAPLQALPEDYAKYQKRYDEGWDRVRATRIAKQRELNLFGKGIEASPRPEHIPAWDSLSESRQSFEIKRMRTLAAMIDRVDQETGRLVEYLRETGQLENTLIWFVSDNGACPYDRVSRGIEAEPTNGDVGYSDSTGWAWARNSPFRFYKQNQFEGGICTPGIIHWPAGLKAVAGSIHQKPAHLIDILPTLAEATSAVIPRTHPRRSLRPVSGQSLMPVLAAKEMKREAPLHFLFSSDRGLRDDHWKAVSFQSGPWELYRLDQDRTELTNLAAKEPQRLQAMVDTWHDMATNVLHASGRNVTPVSSKPVLAHSQWTNFARDPVNSRKAYLKEEATPELADRKNSDRITIRARKNTRMKVSEEGLQLTFMGDDPGIALDQLPAKFFNGPYELSFSLKSTASGSGEVFYTTDATTSLPKGQHQSFEVTHDGRWHDYGIRLETTEQLRKLRLDVSDGEGNAQINALQLIGPAKEVLMLRPSRKGSTP